MRGKFLLAMIVVCLVSLPVAAVDDETSAEEAPTEEEAIDKYGCGEPVKGSGEEVVRPERVRYSRTPLSPRELAAWGPINVTGMIGCDGRVHDLKIDKQLPERLETKLRKKVGRSRFKPATLAGEPVAVRYNLTLNRPR